jgi:hypothetical protein
MLYTAINLDYLAFPSSQIVCKSYSSFFFMAFLSAFIFSYICYQKQFLDPFPSSHKNIVTYIFFVWYRLWTCHVISKNEQSKRKKSA